MVSLFKMLPFVWWWNSKSHKKSNSPAPANGGADCVGTRAETTKFLSSVFQ